MAWLKQLFAKILGRAPSRWDSLNYGKPSAAGDDFRRNNDV